MVDPELGFSVVDLGMIYRLQRVAGAVELDYTLTAMGCPIGPEIEGEMVRVLGNATGGAPVRARLVWDPPWSIDMAAPEIRLELGYAIW